MGQEARSPVSVQTAQVAQPSPRQPPTACHVGSPGSRHISNICLVQAEAVPTRDRLHHISYIHLSASQASPPSPGTRHTWSRLTKAVQGLSEESLPSDDVECVKWSFTKPRWEKSKTHDLVPVHVLLQAERRPQGMGSCGPTRILHTRLHSSNNRPVH